MSPALDITVSGITVSELAIPASVEPAITARSGWRLGLAAGLTPLALAGFAASAIANRPIFALWSLVFVALFTVVLHRAFSSQWKSPQRLASALAAQAIAWAAFALLISRHSEAWDLGLRAFAPALYHPWSASAWTPLTLAAVLALAALSIALWRKSR